MKTLVTLITALMLSTAAIADDGTTRDRQAATFESLDKNADQQISKTEAAADKKLTDSFAAADSNGDGYLSKSEYLARSKT